MPRFTFGTSERTPIENWRVTLDKLNWTKGLRHYSRRAALVRARTLGLTKAEVVGELLQRCDATGNCRECSVRDDIAQFFGSDPRVHSTLQSAAPKVEVDDDLLQSIITAPVTIDELRVLSPHSLSADPAFGEIVIDALFPGNPWICHGYNKRRFFTKRREAVRGQLHRYALIVPQPMTAAKGVTLKGKMSWHSLNNCGSWTHLIVEWDEPITLHEQAALILHLGRKFGGLVLVVFSGCNSLHAWFAVRAWPDERRGELIAYAQRIGACPGSLKNRSQFVRMPSGVRYDHNGKKALQAIHYFDPSETKL
jgi:hypothetical protein